MSAGQPYDVAVIGGGLGGLCLALQLAQAGRKVVLVEKENYPFHKVCGEYISMESWPFLERLGIPLAEFHLPKINRLTVTDATGKPYAFPLPLGGFGISRYKLDALLAQRCSQLGVHMITGDSVTNVTRSDDHFLLTLRLGEPLTARLFAGAWGKRSNLDKQWNRPFMEATNRRLSGWVGVKYHIRYDHPADEIVLHNFADGYCGMSRIEEGKSCLCYLVKSERLKQAGSVEALEDHLLSTNPALAKVLSQAERLYEQPLVISNVSFERKSQMEMGAILLGDAAGLITPLCGNGMSMAMHASKLAAVLMLACLEGEISWPAATEQYQRQWNQAFRRRLATGRLVQSLFGKPAATALLLNTLKALPPLAQALIRQTHGRPF